MRDDNIDVSVFSAETVTSQPVIGLAVNGVDVVYLSIDEARALAQMISAAANIVEAGGTLH